MMETHADSEFQDVPTWYNAIPDAIVTFHLSRDPSDLPLRANLGVINQSIRFIEMSVPPGHSLHRCWWCVRKTIKMAAGLQMRLSTETLPSYASGRCYSRQFEAVRHTYSSTLHTLEETYGVIKVRTVSAAWSRRCLARFVHATVWKRKTCSTGLGKMASSQDNNNNFG